MVLQKIGSDVSLSSRRLKGKLDQNKSNRDLGTLFTENSEKTLQRNFNKLLGLRKGSMPLSNKSNGLSDYNGNSTQRIGGGNSTLKIGNGLLKLPPIGNSIRVRKTNRPSDISIVSEKR